MHRPILALPLLAALAAGCGRAPRSAPAPVALERSALPDGGGTRLLLLPEPGARIGTEYVPTLTLRDGAVVRFDTSAVTSDSAYFAAPPSARVDREPEAVHGLLKASVCRKDEAVCRLVKMEV